jgi:putative transposase
MKHSPIDNTLYWGLSQQFPKTRLIVSIRRECLDHLIIINEDHLRRILREYFDYYHNARPHQSLGRNSPVRRAIGPPTGKVVSIPQVGGLHHLYLRAA